ncbi:aspartate 1-decarboxylase autocleavage activator PanM [Photorhabdus luminescens]|uniref:PanD regulatory factor n=1 Tax=Photorhabdus akhurstii TaxID=171438 RepID=A0ABX8LXW8_9GAMM|nr:aspartate 1-decarboxylase autocleavage activator PanM [Photorhabdus akhurstii]MBS9430084.1 aspartate 1-decarboxylase autocleavage activator PanM [Photorhabdus akhurstii]PQQ32178.1 aspartate 1-decarboxylase autocleavage activator PanM [Photorhabdus luminescens]QXF35354.1 GNAT family N-acetyltransferase [Photorhabdus akhurstii]UJD77186.1 aspartate 1-decarboxylase autocleavage activator PanM [Photorhabdus luminescens]
MKLTIEQLTVLSTQDTIDLKKIWPQQTPEQWQIYLKNDNKLFAARFNDRLLAAVKVTFSDQSGLLKDLCVREITRRRGVGLYLINEIKAQHPTINQWKLNLEKFSNANEPALKGFMSACGFYYDPKSNSYSS